MTTIYGTDKKLRMWHNVGMMNRNDEVMKRLNGSDNSVDLAFEWDPTEPIATRPLFMQQRNPSGNPSNYFFTHDGNKNVSDVVSYQRARGVVAHYDYAPFGAVTSATGSLASINPFRFSSEYHDDTLGLVYYNYWHYNPQDGRWCLIDFVSDNNNKNGYLSCRNRNISKYDMIGLKMSVTDCYSAVKNAIDNDEEVRAIREKLRGNRCRIPPVMCSCNETPEGVGSFNGNTITLETQASSLGVSASVASVLVHEYTHALDVCGGVDMKSCVNILYTELRAYHNCKACLPGGARYKASEPDYFQCIKKAAIGSANKHSSCRGANFDALFRDNEEYFRSLLGL